MYNYSHLKSELDVRSEAGVTFSFPLHVTPHHTAVKKETFGWDGK